MRQIIVIAHNLRSCGNVGSLLRTCEGLGVKKIFLTGYTPYPKHKRDNRLPHIQQRQTKQINKTALGAQDSLDWCHETDILTLIADLKKEGYKTIALEQAQNAVALNKFRASNKIVLIVGREVEGIEPEILNLVDRVVEIPMFGRKESFNVASACAIALGELTFH